MAQRLVNRVPREIEDEIHDLASREHSPARLRSLLRERQRDWYYQWQGKVVVEWMWLRSWALFVVRTHRLPTAQTIFHHSLFRLRAGDAAPDRCSE